MANTLVNIAVFSLFAGIAIGCVALASLAGHCVVVAVMWVADKIDAWRDRRVR